MGVTGSPLSLTLMTSDTAGPEMPPDVAERPPPRSLLQNVARAANGSASSDVYWKPLSNHITKLAVI